MSTTPEPEQDPSDLLSAQAQARLAPLLVGKRLTAFGGKTGLWGRSDKSIEFSVDKVEVVYGDAESENGFVSLDISLEGYRAGDNGLIYTDPTFLESLHGRLVEAGLTGKGVSYSEAGMQGHDRVNLDVSFYNLCPDARPARPA